MVKWCDAVMVLAKLAVPERPTDLDYSRAGLTVLVAGAGGDCLEIFLSIIFYLFFLPLCERTARFRPK